jgi:hypothetical protein
MKGIDDLRIIVHHPCTLPFIFVRSEMLESKFQAELVRDLKELFPGCIVLKNDSSYMQGIPDLLVLYKNYWVALECKDSLKARKQPNQEWYVETMNHMSFAAFIYPENREEIINAICDTFGLGG